MSDIFNKQQEAERGRVKERESQSERSKSRRVFGWSENRKERPQSSVSTATQVEAKGMRGALRGRWV